ncbi:MAG: hypothetical protein IJT30_03075 [Muribaculaceae bacterium]|nr:hypothetical protein [Muribaculaceae bacterium]
MSTEALIASDYFTVCPQCLTRLQIVGNYAYVPLADGTLELSPGQQPAAQESSSPKVPPVTPPLPPPEVAEQPMPASPGAIDPLMGEAIKFLAECNAITPVMLRDRFSIPIERAQAILAQLEQAGVVGPHQNGAPRTILIPHRNELPGVRITQMNDSDNEPQTNDAPNSNKMFTFNCSGCLMWFLIISMAILIFKNCG